MPAHSDALQAPPFAANEQTTHPPFFPIREKVVTPKNDTKNNLQSAKNARYPVYLPLTSNADDVKRLRSLGCVSKNKKKGATNNRTSQIRGGGERAKLRKGPERGHAGKRESKSHGHIGAKNTRNVQAQIYMIQPCFFVRSDQAAQSAQVER